MFLWTDPCTHKIFLILSDHSNMVKNVTLSLYHSFYNINNKKIFIFLLLTNSIQHLNNNKKCTIQVAGIVYWKLYNEIDYINKGSPEAGDVLVLNLKGNKLDIQI